MAQMIDLAKKPRIPKALSIFLILGIGSPFILIFLLKFAFNGTIWGAISDCPYTEKVLTPPPALVGSSIILESSSIFSETGKEVDFCTPLLRKINRQLVYADKIDIRFSSRYGRVLDPQPKGKVFTFEKVVSKTKHGLSAIDSGTGPFFSIIVKDEQGADYVLPSVYLGNGKESYFSYYQQGQRMNALYWDCFGIYYDRYTAKQSRSWATPPSSCWPDNDRLLR